MGDKSSIEWTDATWNPTTGCSKVSPGCKNCYAERLSQRLMKIGVAKYANGFQLTVHPEAFDLPLRWRNPRRIFVNSMSDLFHQDLAFQTIKKVYDVMERADWHTYQILTKRPQIMERFFRGRKVPDHIWLGTSVELRQYLNRLEPLKKIDVKVRFISFEPLLGPIGECDLTGISWAIVGGESGPNHREVKHEWVRELRDQCLDQDVRFFFKQWGGPRPKSNGRRLDGRLWDEYPDLHVLPVLASV
jgi:protein gp37